MKGSPDAAPSEEFGLSLSDRKQPGRKARFLLSFLFLWKGACSQTIVTFFHCAARLTSTRGFLAGGCQIGRKEGSREEE